MELLNDMALFVEVVKANSFSRAAEALEMPNSTLSRRISLLEKEIGLRLLHRTTRRIELTEAGQIYFERSKRIVEEARLAHEQLGEMVAQPTGTLRVSMPVDFATTYVAPLLPKFANLYPGLAFEFDLTPRNVDLVAEPFDLAIRMARPEPQNLIARVIARVSAQLYASPDYLGRYGMPDHPAELEGRQCLTMHTLSSWGLYSGTDTFEVKVGSRFACNSVAMIRRLAALGLGIAFLPERVVAEDLQAGRLVSILPAWQGHPTSVYAVTETRLLPAKTQRFIEFLQEELRGE
ncbi:LysR family transcriptional regulator [Bradyrhizobium manausense]|uniref:LysR family transcriptional regulator n=1 Tax=Bradyrhizobium TaxID=374 RepID=UPI001BA9151E|nr:MULTISPECIES: LysR family transcriptional regulator [Bradyrhizobium]MBR0826904.1 LysR family transcriptional regulator [Bradyrhizobium manausense]UVO32187.1 LysR family transcriptional regulator [Bradyrhizobium arachidis]